MSYSLKYSPDKYCKVKSQIKVTPLVTHLHPNQSPYQVLIFYTLQFQRCTNKQDKILKGKATIGRSYQGHNIYNVNPRLLANATTKYHLPAPYSFQEVAGTIFYRSSHYDKVKVSQINFSQILQIYNPNRGP